MSNPYAVHAASLAAVQTEQGASCPAITWQGNNYPILPGSARQKNDLTPGGFSMDSDFVFMALVSAFGAAQTAEGLKAALLNTEVDYLGHAYKVHTVHAAPGGLQLHIEADDLNQGA
jgi:hypothetical protein